MNQVFEKTSIAGIVLENRILRSATYEGMADEEGYPKSELLTTYERLARNKVGAIITGYVAVQRNGRVVRNMCLFDSDDYIDDYRKLSTKVREHNVPLILQIAHGGGGCFQDATRETVAPSSVSYFGYPRPRALSESEIEEIIGSFVQAVVRARKAEFSAVQIHASHGCLLAAFLSPHFNRRQDRWGGSTENRFRIVGEIIRRARQQVGDYPIFIKISAYDGFKDGATVEESVRLSKMLQEAGYNAIEVSCGNNEPFNFTRVTKIPVQAIITLVPQYSQMPYLQKKLMAILAPLLFKRYQPLRNYNVEAARKIKERVTIPVIVVGGIRRLKDIEEIISENKADYVSMCRSFIIEPDIVAKFLSGKQVESRCIDCGYCLAGGMANQLRCYYGKLPKD
jgi:2,4-dienoyl-CoA reductase-like NADH-dependent reductase (Old Yellow Enzyme family)